MTDAAFEEMEQRERQAHDDKVKELQGQKSMTDEERAEEYIRTLRVAGINSYNHCDVEKAYLNGLTEGKSKWHDLRKDPNDLPKESDKYLCAWKGGEQWIMDFETEVNSFGYWCNVYDNQSLGFVDSVFETIKERGEDEVIAWCELPKYEE